MSRHGRTVPVEFYHRFTRDACALADRIAGGRIISILEGTSMLDPSRQTRAFADHSEKEGTVTEHSSVAPLRTLRGLLGWKLILPVIGGHRTP